MPASCVGGTALPSLGALTMHGASSPLSWQRLPPHELRVLREAGKRFVIVCPRKRGDVDSTSLGRAIIDLTGRQSYLACLKLVTSTQFRPPATPSHECR